MKNIIHISNVNLDGYTCSALIRYLGKTLKDDYSLMQYNVDHTDLSRMLVDLEDRKVDDLIITGLSLKEEQVLALKAMEGRVFQQLVLLDDECCIRDLILSLFPAPQHTVRLKTEYSATALLYAYLLDLDPTLREHIDSNIVLCVDAYDQWKEKDVNFTEGFFINKWIMDNFMPIITAKVPHLARDLVTHMLFPEQQSDFFDRIHDSSFWAYLYWVFDLVKPSHWECDYITLTSEIINPMIELEFLLAAMHPLESNQDGVHITKPCKKIDFIQTTTGLYQSKTIRASITPVNSNLWDGSLMMADLAKAFPCENGTSWGNTEELAVQFLTHWVYVGGDNILLHYTREGQGWSIRIAAIALIHPKTTHEELTAWVKEWIHTHTDKHPT